MSEAPGDPAVAPAEVWRLMVECWWAQQGRFMGILQEAGLTPGHMKALFSLEPGRAVAMGSLAVAWACDPSNVTWLVDRLEVKGLVERRVLPNDRRVKSVVLTDRGEALRQRLLARLYEPPDAWLELASETLKTVRSALEKLLGGETAAPKFGPSGPAKDAAERERAAT